MQPNRPPPAAPPDPAARAVLGLVDQVEAALAAATADDLAALAAVHTCLQRLTAEAGGLTRPGLAGGVGQFARGGEKLVEQVILRECADADAALRGLAGSAGELRRLLHDSGGTGACEFEPPPAAAPAPPAAPAAPAIGDETPLNPEDVPIALEFVGEANAHLDAVEANLLKIDAGDDAPEAINAIFRGFHTIKGVAGFMNLRQIGALSHAAESLLDLARQGKVRLAGGMVDLVLESADVMKKLVASLDAAAAAGRAVDVRPELPALLARLRAAAAGGSVAAAPAGAPSPDDPPADADSAGGPHLPGGEATVKVATERLDRLINLVGELVVAHSMVSQDVAAAGHGPRAARNVAHLGKLTRELQALAMSMRMVPIGGVFQKMARVVRDLGRKAGKDVELAVAGGETELDRNVVEAIGDPLVHMVRNAIDHGIEPPADRARAGKPRAGRVSLSARHEAGSIVVEIADDGRGLNQKRIVEKAAAAGLIAPGQELTEGQVFNLIFHAGLSTAEAVTDISGRGVGMDVVKRNVEALRGRIDIASAAGAGSTFSIQLPLTLAVIDGLIVRVGPERYVVPITGIEQSIRPRPDQLSTVHGRGEVCLVRGRLLPVARLHRLFGVTPRTEDPADGLVVIVQDNQRRCCLFVDDLLGQQQVVIKSLGESIGPVPGVSGGAVLGDGGISLILDVPGLLDMAAA